MLFFEKVFTLNFALFFNSIFIFQIFFSPILTKINIQYKWIINFVEEAVSIIGISILQMLMSIIQGLQLFFTLEYFSIEIISLPLQLFPLLTSLNDIISLRMLLLSSNLPCSCLWFLNKRFVFNAQIFNHVLTFR